MERKKVENEVSVEIQCRWLDAYFIVPYPINQMVPLSHDSPLSFFPQPPPPPPTVVT
jgi:hypothetical protein